MKQPLVSVIMPSSPGREAMRARAIRSFDAQTYQPRELIVLPATTGATIGEMRNRAVELASGEIIVHQDDDDISGPQRIEEQVALLQSSGADCVGYYEALFWDTRAGQFCASYIYRDPTMRSVLGASMCYWRRCWEAHKFDHISHGEDSRFAQRLRTVSVSGIERKYVTPAPGATDSIEMSPALICGIHGANTSHGYSEMKGCFRRAAEFDDYARGAMKL